MVCSRHASCSQAVDNFLLDDRVVQRSKQTTMKSPSISAVLLLLLPFSYALKFELVAQHGHNNERCIRNFVTKDTLVVVTAIVSGSRGDGQMVNMHVCHSSSSYYQRGRNAWPGACLGAGETLIGQYTDACTRLSRSKMLLATIMADQRTWPEKREWLSQVWRTPRSMCASRTP